MDSAEGHQPVPLPGIWQLRIKVKKLLYN